MARIELKNTVIRLKDGWAGAGLVDDTSIAGGNTTLEIDTLTGLPGSLTTVPAGVRFTIDTVANTTFVVTDSNANEQQELDLDTPSAGTFTLTFDGQGPTGAIQWDASANDIQTELISSLSNISAGDVVVTGSSLGPFVIEYRGQYLATNVALMTVDGGSLTNAGGLEDISVLHEGATTWELTFTPALDAGDLPANNDERHLH
jgi:hypothetical protein